MIGGWHGLDDVVPLRSSGGMGDRVFVGRVEELVDLSRVLRGESTWTAAVVTGDAGMGKTRLVEQAWGASPALRVLTGPCLPLSRSLPFLAIAEALAGLRRSDEKALVTAVESCAPYVRDQISSLVPGLAAADAPARDHEGDRAHLFSAVRDVLGALAERRRTVLVVEDLHWADEATLDLLTYLLTALPPSVALVLTCRRADVVDSAPVLDWLATVARLERVVSIALPPLTPQESDELVRLMDSSVDDDTAADVVRRGEGNPLFTEQLAAAAIAGAAPSEVPPDVERLLRRRLDTVEGLALDAAEVLAVAERPLREAELDRCLGAPAAVALRELLAARLADRRGDEFALQHALLADVVRSTLLPSRLASLHAAVAEALSGRPDLPPAELVAHWRRADRPVPELSACVAAAAAAEEVYAWHSAAQMWERAWDLWPDVSEGDRPPTRLGEIAVRAAQSARWAGTGAEERRLLDRALADGRLTTDRLSYARLLTAYGAHVGADDLDTSVHALEQAVNLVEDLPDATAEHARALHMLGHLAATHGLADGAVTIARAVAVAAAGPGTELDERIALRVQGTFARVEAGDGPVDDAVRDMREVLEQNLGGRSPMAVLWAGIGLTDTLLWLARPAECVALGRRALADLVDHGFGARPSTGYLAGNVVECALLQGDPTTAHEILQVGTTAAPEAESPALVIAAAAVATVDGDPPQAMDLLTGLSVGGAHLAETVHWAGETMAQAQVWGGRPDAVPDTLHRTWDVVGGTPVARRAARLLAVAARAAADAPDPSGFAREASADELEGLAGDSGCYDDHPGRVLARPWAATFSAEMARLRGADDADAWRVARDAWTAVDARHQAAYAEWRLAERLLRNRHSRAGETALRNAAADAEEHLPLAKEVDALARRARVSTDVGGVAAGRQAAGSDAVPPAAAAYHLTPREVDVLRLLGDGMTNREIGRALFMSPRTASVHVTSILRKLGVRGRVQAATAAEQMGLLETGRSHRV